MAWYRLNLGDAMLAEARLSELTDILASEPSGCKARVYWRHESEGQLHCDLVLYFPPGSAGQANIVGALPCADPGEGLEAIVLGGSGP